MFLIYLTADISQTHPKDSMFITLKCSYLFNAYSLEMEQKSRDIQEIKTFILQCIHSTQCWDLAS